jgi:peptide deformylase
MSQILLYPHPMLTTKQEYNPELDDFDTLVRMFGAALLYKYETGEPILGLAANQIDIATRIILYRDSYDGYLKPLIDPTITFYDDLHEIDWEACGSFPGLEVEVPRAKNIFVSYIDSETLKYRIDMFSDLEARIIQHEVDHLDGITILHREV